MTTTATAKPKAKFSSRNLSAVFKAPLRSKPLPDNAVGPLQRPNNRMLVLGRAGVAPPAPINTPSLKRESQVHDVRVSLVPAGSNWAEKHPKTEDTEAFEASEEVVPPPEAPEKVWTPESVAEHLHTAKAAKAKTAESSGRWGDDAVEHDLFQTNIRRQMQKERDFPDLLEAVEETQLHHGRGHSSAADRSPSLGPQQSEQRHGRAAGRWAYFSEQEESRHPRQEDRWSRDRSGREEDDRWSRDHYDRDDGDRWSRDRYARDEDDRCSRGRSLRCDDGYGRERCPNESNNSTVSPIRNDSRTHFSRSDARFDMVASGNRDRVLSHSPHRMDWNSGRLGRRGERSSSPAPLHRSDGHRLHTPQSSRSPTLSSALTSPSPAPVSHPLATDVAPARPTNWRSLALNGHEPDRVWGPQYRSINVWSKPDEPSAPVAEVAESNTDSSSNSSASSNPIIPEQVQLLKRPRMLFDPRTGGMVSAEDKVTSNTGKRQSGSRNGGRDREPANVAATREVKAQDTAKSGDRGMSETEAKATELKIDESKKSSYEEEAPVAVIAVNSVETSTEEPSLISSNVILAEQVAGSTSFKSFKRENKRVTTKQLTTSRATKPTRDPRPKQAPTSQTHRSQTPINADARVARGKRSATSTRNDRRATGDNKNFSGHTVQLASVQKVDPTEVARLKQIADGVSGNVVLVTQPQEDIEVSPDEDGFETVKPRRVVLSERKQLRQRLASGEAAARASEFGDDKKSTQVRASEKHADEQSKGDDVEETFGMVPKRVSNPRSKPGKDRKQKGAQRQAKQSGSKVKESKQIPAKVVTEQPAVKSTEQVAGEAPAESPLSRKKFHSAKATTEPKREWKPRKLNARKPSDAKASDAERKQEPTQQQDDFVAPRTAEKVPVAKAAARAKPKQSRKMYVVKTPAPGWTSTAA